MTDLIERLRGIADEHLAFEANEIVHKAADELERLQSERIAPDHVYERNRELLLEVDKLQAIAETAENLTLAQGKHIEDWWERLEEALAAWRKDD